MTLSQFPRTGAGDQRSCRRARGLAQLREQRQNLVSCGGADGPQGLRPGIEGLGFGPVRTHDLMLVEEQVEILDLGGVDLLEPFDLQQLFGGNQNFGTAEHALRDIRADQNPVLRRDQKILGGQAMSQRASANADRTQARRRGQIDGVHGRA